MAKVVGIRFKQAGKIYHFSPGNIETKLGDHVIVETSRGIEYGTIVVAEHEEEKQKINQPLKEVLRIATAEDTEHEAENKKKEMEAFVICLDKIRQHGLEMKLIDCEITFDNSKILFYFTADGRIDFRDLVKDLASVFHIRIELRQEGVRDETKTLGGLGSCGRELCCHSYLTDFVPVSIKMAKNQNLSLNTSKISGVCGRLMCCLNYEEDVYEELNRMLPSAGDTAFTPDGLKGIVSSVGTLKRKVKVLVDLPNDEKEIREYDAGELKIISRKKGAPRHEAAIFKDEAVYMSDVLPDDIDPEAIASKEELAEMEGELFFADEESFVETVPYEDAGHLDFEESKKQRRTAGERKPKAAKQRSGRQKKEREDGQQVRDDHKKPGSEKNKKPGRTFKRKYKNVQNKNDNRPGPTGEG